MQWCNACRESTFRRSMTFVCIGKRWHSLCFYYMIVDIFNHFFACLDPRCISDYDAERNMKSYTQMSSKETLCIHNDSIIFWLFQASKNTPVAVDHCFSSVIVVVNSSHPSPSWGVSRFRSAQSITILLPVCSASKGSRKSGRCLEATDHSHGNGCALSGRFYSCTHQGFGCDLCADEPVQFMSSLEVSVCLLQWTAVGQWAALMSCFQWQFWPHLGGCCWLPNCNWRWWEALRWGITACWA